jgi:hypothetical protein
MISSPPAGERGRVRGRAGVQNVKLRAVPDVLAS